MRKMNSKIRTKFISESGSYLQNKDYFAFVELDRYAIYVIADGIDNDTDLISSKLAVKQIISSFTEQPTMGRWGLTRLLRKANEELRKESLKEALKASVTVVVTNYVKCRYALVGNTRFTLFRDGYAKYKSEDQSLTQELLKEEKISLDKAAKHEERNNLYCYLGQKERLEPYISKTYRMKSGDTIALYTRGIWENLYKSELLDGLSEIADPEEGINNIEELILSKQPKDLDNYTIAIIFIDKTYENPQLKKTIKKVIVISIIIIILLSILGFFLYRRHKAKLKKIEDMEYYKENAEEYISDNNYFRAKEEYIEALKLAKKLESGKDRDFIDERIKLMESIIEADASLENKEYNDAVDKYLAARSKAYYVDNIGLEYIGRNLEETRDYILVLDLLMEADKKFEIGDLSGSQDAYRRARDLARSLYYKEAKDEAVQRLEQIYELNQKNKEEQDRDRESQQLEQEEINKQRIALQESAMQAYKDGNESYKIGDYSNAKMHYEIALFSYQELKIDEIAKQIEKRLLDVENKLIEAKASEFKASQYEKSGDEEFNNNKLVRAKMLYILSKDMYAELELEEDVNRLTEKIEGLDPLIPRQGI